MITVLMPSRGRERQATEAYVAFEETKALSSTQMLVVLDAFEPGYVDLPTLRVTHAGGMANALNASLVHVSPDIYGFIGDDHRFRTQYWDEQIEAQNDVMGGGIIYGDDLLRGEELPSQVFIDKRIVKTLGWMALPGAKHLYLDDTWRELGQRLGRLAYMPEIVIEHMHFTAGKSERDEGYRRVNDQDTYNHDAAVFHAWMKDGIDADVERVLAALDA